VLLLLLLLLLLCLLCLLLCLLVRLLLLLLWLPLLLLDLRLCLLPLLLRLLLWLVRLRLWLLLLLLPPPPLLLLLQFAERHLQRPERCRGWHSSRGCLCRGRSPSYCGPHCCQSPRLWLSQEESPLPGQSQASQRGVSLQRVLASEQGLPQALRRHLHLLICLLRQMHIWLLLRLLLLCGSQGPWHRCRRPGLRVTGHLLGLRPRHCGCS
jgi:hypothetical protein